MGRLKKKSRLNPPSHQLSLGRIPLASLIQTLAVAEHLSFYRAAQALGTSQSNVSARIKALEQDLGILLFERNTRGVRLTEAGRLFVERVAAGVDQLDHAVKTAGMAASGECGRLRVGIHALMPRSFLAELIAQFRDGRRVRGIATALGSGCTLRRIGVFGRFDLDRHNHPMEMCGSLGSTLAINLLSPSFDLESIQRSLLRPAPAAALSLGDFCHQPEAAMIVNYMACALKRRSRGVNVLIHGDPGTGKTEFVRALAQSLGARLDEVPVEDEDRDPISGEARFRAYTLAQRLLARNRGQLLLFDEVEDVFGSGGATLLSALVGKQGRDPESLAKGWINLTLESNSVPAIWVCNDIRAVDPAYLRRFDLVAQFRTPPRKVRERIVERYFPDALLSETGVAALSELEALPPAQIERAAKVVKALGSKRRDERDAQAKRIVEMSLLLGNCF